MVSAMADAASSNLIRIQELPSSSGGDVVSDAAVGGAYQIEYIDPFASHVAVAERRFRALADRWKSETAMLSSVEEMAIHPAYQQIIGLGPRAIPLILAELHRSPDHWFWALQAIVGFSAIAPENAGNVQRMALDWLDWGKRRGYSLADEF